MKFTYRWISLTLFLLSLFASISHAAVFSIVPKAGTTLPTQVPPGGSVPAFYTITNTTAGTRTGNYVKWLPPNVTQVLAQGACGATFDLAANQSCTLQLSVNGPVNGSDPNPEHHLFACLGGCVTCCAGTNSPLNVTTSSSQTAFIANQNGGVSVCNIVNNGFTNCMNTGNGFSGPNAVVYSPDFSYLYVSDSVTNKVSVCPITANHTLGTCTAYADTNATFDTPDGIAFTALGTVIYVTNFSNGTISTCPIDPITRGIGACTATGGFNNPASIRINAAGTFAYISDFGQNTLSACAINANNSLGACTTTGGFSAPDGISKVINNRIYVTNNGNNSISICNVQANGSIGTCTNTAAINGLNMPDAIDFNSTVTYAYISNLNGNNVSICVVNADGTLGTCNNDPNMFARPHGVAIQ